MFPLEVAFTPRGAPGTREFLASAFVLFPELVDHPPFRPIPTEPPAGAGGIAARCPRNLRLSSSWESSKVGMSPGRAGRGGVEK